ncbi:ATP-binding protein [Anaerosinus massiliensis]|uniref:ATP-binding protein n=1 Tax=Massilibacillus massiliensis TaxID=1806837 RepID=UPI0018FE6E88|nr:ATP-binding protein [Massilibacillus massiliensis]
MDSNRVTVDELERCGIYKRFQNITLESIHKHGLPDGYNDIYQQVCDYANDLDNNIEQGIGILMKGGVGTLKTTLAIAVLRYQLDRGKFGMFVPMCSLIDNLFTMQKLNKEEWARYEIRIRTTPILVLDDLGGENTDQSWITSKVDSIITDRYNRQRPIIVTTNLNTEELKGTYSGRIYDRLKSTSKVITLRGESQRKAV